MEEKQQLDNVSGARLMRSGHDTAVCPCLALPLLTVSFVCIALSLLLVAVAQLEALGFSRQRALEAWLLSDRNEMLAANYLLSVATRCCCISCTSLIARRSRWPRCVVLDHSSFVSNCLSLLLCSLSDHAGDDMEDDAAGQQQGGGGAQ